VVGLAARTFEVYLLFRVSLVDHQLPSAMNGSEQAAQQAGETRLSLLAQQQDAEATLWAATQIAMAIQATNRLPGESTL
jgi:hypothetical protein